MILATATATDTDTDTGICLLSSVLSGALLRGLHMGHTCFVFAAVKIVLGLQDMKQMLGCCSSSCLILSLSNRQLSSISMTTLPHQYHCIRTSRVSRNRAGQYLVALVL